ncbi:MAG: DUF362 domain-containing protein [Planctomycetota bacterium]
MAPKDDKGNLSRRDFIIAAGAAAAGLGALRTVAELQGGLEVRGFAQNDLSTGISIIHGDAGAEAAAEKEAEVVEAMTRRAVGALGGMEKLVNDGDTVVIKPNIAWVRPPRMATNTNPWVVAALVKMCLEAGAGTVKVMDNTISKNPANSYQASGIARAARDAGAEVPYVARERAMEMEIPEAQVLEKWVFCREFIDAAECDVLINAPILKHHGTSKLSIGLKNGFGMVSGDRGKLHPEIHQKIPDLHRLLRVDLTVMDCYRVLRTHGPTGGSLEDVDSSVEGARRVVASRDPVAVDSYGAGMFGFEPPQIGFVKNAAEAGLGTAEWQGLDVTEETV